MSVALIKLHDTLSGKKVAFKPKDPGLVRVYGCGPTVYGFTHVGNARAFLTQDLVVRSLRAAGYAVEFARNYTDIDDKIIQRANTENKSSDEIARFYANAFDENMRALDIQPPDFAPRATATIREMIQMIQALEQKGLAYAAGGDVYFRVEKFPTYGCLSHRKLKDMMTGSRIEAGEQKEHPADFALWKGAKPGEPSWESPWGQGRPGWHIECSAMIHSLFGDGLDIHMGGLDLIFPHHENEIAQSEAFTEKKLASYWLHNGMLEVGREKMSKSLGNLMTISDFVSDFGAETLRVLFAQNHYRSPLEFSREAILRCEALVDRLYLAKQNALNAAKVPDAKLPQELERLSERMHEALFDDFNSAKALGFALAAARVGFRENKPEIWKAWAQALPVLQEILALAKRDPAVALQENRARRLRRMKISVEQSEEIDLKLQEREKMRAEKNFAASDRIRLELEARGVAVMDGPDGSTWTVEEGKEK